VTLNDAIKHSYTVRYNDIQLYIEDPTIVRE